MIPKVIHYCWFGGKPLDKLGQQCLESWRKFFPDYEIVEWNENNFDVNCCTYVKQAYAAKKWAFVSDYVRFKVLYEQGGVYFDTDVEVIKSFAPILEKGGFMGCERNANSVNPGLGFAVDPGLDIIKELLDDYEKSTFLGDDGSYNLMTIVDRTTSFLKKYGLEDKAGIQTVAGISVYPRQYFCPIDMETGKLKITKDTYSIHHFAASWESKSNIVRGKIYRLINRYFGEKIATVVKKIVGRKRKGTVNK